MYGPYPPPMDLPDLNLLVALRVLLEEEGVAPAARRLRLSPSAMSRTLARLRRATGDPLLVRAGRGLVPTPRAVEIRAQIAPVLQEAVALLQPTREVQLDSIETTFTLRCAEGFAENYGVALVDRLRRDAPRARASLIPRQHQDDTALRQGTAHAAIGVIRPATSPELHSVKLFDDRFVGVVHRGHPLARGKVTLARYCRAKHVGVFRHVGAHRSAPGPIDGPLQARRRERDIVVIVGGFGGALALARSADLVATVPERHTGNLRKGMCTFSLPFSTAPVTISLLWHPRLQRDPTHRFFRRCIREVCAPDA